LEDGNGGLVVYRLGWLAGFAGIAFALARVERLLRASVSGIPWELTLIGAILAGAAITWAGLALRMRGWIVLAVNAIAVAVTVLRIAVPETTVWGVIPTADSFAALGDELALARDVIRSGVAPVIPLGGIVAILAVVFWTMGGLLAWGLLAGRPYVAVLTPLVVYLEFAVMDKRPGGAWTTVFMAVIGFALVAVALDRRRDGTGRLSTGLPRRAVARSVRWTGAVALVVALGIAVASSEAMAGLVPRSGYLDWRSGTGLTGEYYGSITYNPFVGIRQQLISQTEVPVFVATVTGDLAPSAVYWRLVTLDAFNGQQWHIGSGAEIEHPEDRDALEAAADAFAGDTASIRSAVTILALQQDWLPAPYAPFGFAAENEAVAQGYRVKSDDASLRFDALTYRGMNYVVDSRVPVPDLEVLGRLADGSPSIFAGAIGAGDFEFATAATPPPERILVDADRFLGLPTDLDPDIFALAAATTRGLQTDFERALALESFFLTPGNFRYSTDILPGHAASDLASWLLDRDSDNFRTGYCEQFATAMAVMARLLDIPSRVVLGFTPGTVLDDGRVVVLDRNAHAWVELWMPTQGWMRFDPTPRGNTAATTAAIPFEVAPYLEVPEPERPVFEPRDSGPVIFQDDEFEIRNEPTELPTGTGLRAPGIPDWVPQAIVVAAAMFGLVPAVKWVRRRRRRRHLAAGDITAAWREIVDRLADLGDDLGPATTPVEFAAGIDPALQPLAGVYSEAAYGPETPGSSTVLVAERSLETAEAGLILRYTRGRRLLAAYRLVSLAPAWWRRRRLRRR
jgi:transglutaminase-like putative cysteine protease